MKPAILGDTKRVGIILALYSVDRSSKLSPMCEVYARTDRHRSDLEQNILHGNEGVNCALGMTRRFAVSIRTHTPKIMT